MKSTVSIAIETSCLAGGAALGTGDTLVEVVAFDSSRRHAAQLVTQLDALLGSAGLRPTDVDEVYISVGPGSFTGVRVGITVARTLGQFVPSLRCVAVPTIQAVAERAQTACRDHLGVVLDAGGGEVYAGTFRRDGEALLVETPAATMSPEAFGEAIPRPILLTGEGLWYHEVVGEGVDQADEGLRLPTGESVWRVGRRLAADGAFTPYSQLLPIYTRPPQVTTPRPPGLG